MCTGSRGESRERFRREIRRAGNREE